MNMKAVYVNDFCYKVLTDQEAMYQMTVMKKNEEKEGVGTTVFEGNNYETIHSMVKVYDMNCNIAQKEFVSDMEWISAGREIATEDDMI